MKWKWKIDHSSTSFEIKDTHNKQQPSRQQNDVVLHPALIMHNKWMMTPSYKHIFMHKYNAWSFEIHLKVADANVLVARWVSSSWWWSSLPSWSWSWSSSSPSSLPSSPSSINYIYWCNEHKDEFIITITKTAREWYAYATSKWSLNCLWHCLWQLNIRRQCITKRYI